jgi:hypothetical protein
MTGDTCIDGHEDLARHTVISKAMTKSCYPTHLYKRIHGHRCQNDVSSIGTSVNDEHHVNDGLQHSVRQHPCHVYKNVLSVGQIIHHRHPPSSSPSSNDRKTLLFA